MSKDSFETDVLRIDPRRYMTWVAFMHDCCNGCKNEYDNSHSKNSERIDECLSCMRKLEPIYRNQIPFVLDRKTGEIKIET